MTDKLIVYQSDWDEMSSEAATEMALDIGAWLWIWIPVIVKWYLLVALLFFITYEVVTTVRKGFNGIGDGITFSLVWPLIVLAGIKPIFHTIWTGEKLQW